MAYQSIIYEKEGAVAYITLNRPEKMNALSTQAGGLLEEWEDACNDAKKDAEIRVVIIKGAGRCFSAGYDLVASSGLIGSSVEQMYDQVADHVDRYVRVLWENPKIFIAQVHGYCLAGGGDMAAFCDITIAADDALFGYPAVRYGVLPTTFIWPYLIGMKKTMELSLTGNMISAQEAYTCGLVNKVVPMDQLDEEVDKFAQTIIMTPAFQNKLLKQSVHNIYELMGFRQAIQQSRELDIHLFSSPPPELAEFFKIVQEKGLKPALEWRDAKFAEADKISRDRRARKYH